MIYRGLPEEEDPDANPASQREKEIVVGIMAGVETSHRINEQSSLFTLIFKMKNGKKKRNATKVLQ